MKKTKKPENKNLFLVCREYWYDKINSGAKTKEYRQVTDHYTQLLFKKKYETITLARAYTKTQMRFKINSIKKVNTPNDLNLPEVYEISLGERIF